VSLLVRRGALVGTMAQPPLPSVTVRAGTDKPPQRCLRECRRRPCRI